MSTNGTNNTDDSVKLYRESHAFVRHIIHENNVQSMQVSSYPYNMNGTNNIPNTLVLEESSGSGKKTGVFKKVANILASAAKNKAKDKMNEASSDVKDKASKAYHKLESGVNNNKGKIAMGAAALTTANITAHAIMGKDDEDTDSTNTTEKINESEYTDKLYSTKSEPADPTKEDNDSGINFVEKKDPKNPKDQVEYAHKTLPKEENLVGDPKPENAVAVETVEESGNNTCCESCKTGGTCESLQESTEPQKTQEVNLYSMLSKII